MLPAAVLWQQGLFCRQERLERVPVGERHRAASRLWLLPLLLRSVAATAAALAGVAGGGLAPQSTLIGVVAGDLTECASRTQVSVARGAVGRVKLQARRSG
jgi:hypothetical protein